MLRTYSGSGSGSCTALGPGVLRSRLGCHSARPPDEQSSLRKMPAEYYDSIHARPDKPLVVKCAFDKWTKRVTFSSCRNCSYDLLRARV